jgi:hypothetical protein
VLEGVIVVDVLCGVDQLEAWVLASTAWRKALAEDNRHFVLLFVSSIVRHFINAGGPALLARLKHVSSTSSHFGEVLTLPLNLFSAVVKASGLTGIANLL